MGEKRGETGKLICDFPTEAVNGTEQHQKILDRLTVKEGSQNLYSNQSKVLLLF